MRSRRGCVCVAVDGPLPGEGGAYTVGAAHPGLAEAPVQDSDFAAVLASERVVLLQRGDPETARLWQRLVDMSTAYFNDVYGNTVRGGPADYLGLDDLTGSAGNISADPRLVDHMTGRLHLQPDSPCLDAGADDYLVKPFDPEELRLRVDNLIEGRKRHAEHLRADRGGWEGGGEMEGELGGE